MGVVSVCNFNPLQQDNNANNVGEVSIIGKDYIKSDVNVLLNCPP